MPRRSNKANAASTYVGVNPNWNQGPFNDDMFPIPTGMGLIRDMSVMAKTDDTVGSMMWTIRTVISQLDWHHQPMKNGKLAEDDAEAIRWSDFADTLLQDMQISFAEHAEEACTMVWAGFAPCEIVTKQRLSSTSMFSDGYYGIDHIPLRDQRSFYGVTYEDNDPNKIKALRQSTYRGMSEIPMWKLCNYRADAHLDSPWGNPIIQQAWKPWKYKNRAQESEMVGMERDMVGLPIFRMPMEDMEKASEKGSDGKPTAEALVAQARVRAAQTAVKDMRFNRNAGLVLASDTWGSEEDTNDRTYRYDFALVTTAGQRTIDTRTVVRDYDRSIARTALMQFLHLGDRSGGSYALSDDQSTMAVQSLEALAKKIKDQWRKSVLMLIWIINAFPMEYLPALAHGPVTKEGLTAIGTFLRGVGGILDLVDGDPIARRSVLQAASIKSNKDAQVESASVKNETKMLAADPPEPAPAPPQQALPAPKKDTSS